MTEMSEYSSFIALSRYARWKEDENRRETWEETVDRYAKFFQERLPNRKPKAREEFAEAIQGVKDLQQMGSMRSLMTAGEALKRDNVAGFNCSYLAIDHPRAFDELMYILMCGTGVGFSVERQDIAKLPIIDESFHDTDTTIIVRDSKIGWAKAFKELITMLYSGNVPQWDVSKVRPAGSKLKTFGGRASGSDPLVDLFRFSVRLFKGAAGRKLSSIECHDLCCKIADIVVVGGVRRSALISLSNLSDDRIRSAKSGQWWMDNPQRALANNSVCYTEKPDFDSFLKEWHSLYDSKSGERGMFSRVAAKNKVAENGRRDPDHNFGTNPCCFTGDMKLLTSSGYKTFSYLDGMDVEIIDKNGDFSKSSVWCSGQKPTVEVRLHGKDSITCTPDHNFMLNNGKECEAKDLKGKRPMPYFSVKNKFTEYMGDAFLAGFIQGDGSTGRLKSLNHKGLEVHFGEKDGDIAEMYCQEVGKWYSREAMRIAQEYKLSPSCLPERELPKWLIEGDDFTYNPKVKASEFLGGLYSANGCVIKGHRVAFKTTCRELSQQLKWLLKELWGIDAYITTNKSKKVTFSNGDYVCKESYDVNISRYESVVKFAKEISFGQAYKRKDLSDLIKLKAPVVSSVNDFGVQKIYDFTEPNTHWGVVEGCVVHNSEIILRPNQFCNLSEVVIREEDTLETLKKKVKMATILGTLQATLTDFKYLRPIWKRNTEEEALLGVSFTGIMDNAFMSGKGDGDAGIAYNFCGDEDRMISGVLKELKQVAIDTNKEWAEMLGINQAAAITCVKPSGTVSQLVDSSSGIHARFSDHYIRTVRADKRDPLAMMMTDAGFPVEDCVMKGETTQVFSFPIKSPENSVKVSDQTAMEQLEVWKIYQDCWTEHKPSITVYYKDSEFLEIGQWLYNNFDNVSGISFLPYSDHSYQQAPYQPCTEEQYNEAVSCMPKDVDWTKLGEYEKEDNTTSTQTFACTGSVCEIVDLTG